ncbi:MAG: Ig-like domain repeat protein, partial [Bacteroidales bacterium]|nr:Ig-like domain repeat protein [Bacteroidales bacterium]
PGPAKGESLGINPPTGCLTSSANPSVFGQSTTFTATVSVTAPGAGSPSGAVTFYDGATVLGTTALSGGTATFSLDSLDVNNHSITAEYNGDGSFHTSISTATTQTVSPAQLTVTVASLAGVSGSPLPAFTYTVNGLVNGDPEAVVSGINLTSPATPISLPGTYPIIARGGMASNYAITYVDGTLTLTAAPPPTAQTAVSGSNGSVQVLAPDGSVAYTFTPFAGARVLYEQL